MPISITTSSFVNFLMECQQYATCIFVVSPWRYDKLTLKLSRNLKGKDLGIIQPHRLDACVAKGPAGSSVVSYPDQLVMMNMGFVSKCFEADSYPTRTKLTADRLQVSSWRDFYIYTLLHAMNNRIYQEDQNFEAEKLLIKTGLCEDTMKHEWLHISDELGKFDVVQKMAKFMQLHMVGDRNNHYTIHYINEIITDET